MRNKKNLGDLGEELAAKFLEEKGYQILYRNFLGRGFELDIIAKKNDLICICEVKTRKSYSYGRAIEAIDAYKINSIIYGSQVFLNKFNLYNFQIRYDVIEVYPIEKKINHIENAFDLG